MPYHLELGSGGHSFGGKAIVVNSRTGEHYSSHPLGVHSAYRQLKALRAAEPKMMKGKHEAQKEEMPEREEEGVKEVKAKEEKPAAPLADDRAPTKYDSPRTSSICHLADWIRNNYPFITSAFMKQTGNTEKSFLYYIDDISKKGLPDAKYLKEGVCYKGVCVSVSDEDVFAILFEEEKLSFQASHWLYMFKEHIGKKIQTSRGKVITEKMLGTTRGDIEEGAPAPAPAPAPAKEAPAAKKDALAEFVQTAPEDITGVDYGAKNKEGKLQQGVITKMLGRESLDIAKNIIVSCQGGEKRQSYARLCGAISFLENIARGEMNDFSDVKAHTYDTYHLGRMKKEKEPLLDIEEDPAYRAANMSVRILANHEKSLIQAYPNPDPKRLTRPIAVYRLLPTSKTVALIDAQMPKGFNSEVRHVSGMGHARDNYKWQIDTSGMNLRAKAGKEARDAKVAECKRIAKGLLDSLLANLKEGAYLYLDKGHKAQEEEKATEKAKGAAAFEIPQGEKNAVKVFLTEDILRSIILAITGDPKKASAKVEEYRAEGHLGKQALVYRSNRGNKNVNIKFVKD